MSSVPKNQEEKEMESPLAESIRTTIKVVAWPFAAVSAYFSSAAVVRNEIYKNVARTGIFDSSRKTRKNDPLRKLFDASKEAPNPSIPDLMKGINEDYRQDVKTIFEHAGFHTLKDYWKGLNRNQQIQAGVFGATVGGIMLGAMLEIANNKGLLERMTRVEKELKNNDDQGVTP